MQRDEELNAAYQEIDRLRGGLAQVLNAVTCPAFDPFDVVDVVTEVTEELLDDRVVA